MNTQTTIAGVTFKNPVMTASGTFGSGMEYEEFVDQGCGKCTLARESDAPCGGGVRWHAQCHRITESRH